MSFLVRSAETNDLNGLLKLTSQFVLLNLPPDKNILTGKIEKSIESFNEKLPVQDSEYLFLIEDIEKKQVVGSSLIIAKHGTPDSPHLFFKVLQKNRISEDLGIGFIHKVLRFCEETDGPTEIGGLLVDRDYRRRPEKVGKQISLIRFLYITMNRPRFMDKILCELTPPLSKDGRSEFWEALGRRFTGLPYQEADHLSQLNKEFIQQLFPTEDIYLSLLDSKARLVMGRTGENTRPAQHLLESIGFEYLNEVDPFDGGPHFGAKTDDISLIKDSHWSTIVLNEKGPYTKTGLVGLVREGKFRGILTQFNELENQLSLPETTNQLLGVSDGEKVCFSPVTV